MTNSNGPLLTSEQHAACEQISKTDKSPDSQRARVLLALNEGMSQAKAGELAGMTIGQVRYCLKRFRESGTGIFSTEDQTAEIETKADASSEGAVYQINENKAEKKKDKKNNKKKKDRKKSKNKKDKKTKKKKDKKAGKKSGKSKKSKKQKK